MNDANPADSADLLYGAPAIAAFLGIRPRQAYHLIEKAALPSFHIKGKVCARRSTLRAWLAQIEAASVVAPVPTDPATAQEGRAA